MVTIEPDMKRIRLIAKRWNAGSQQSAIARDLGISRERVRQVLRKQCIRYEIPVLTKEEWDTQKSTGQVVAPSLPDLPKDPPKDDSK